MSFPSALAGLEIQGVTPETANEEQAKMALIRAIQKDTADGYTYLCGIVSAFKERAEDAVSHVRQFINGDGRASEVLRAEWLPSGGLKVDVDPNSKLGGQVMRLLGTDAARDTLEEHFGMSFALANCCGGITGGDKKQTKFSVAEQIGWQASIDC